MLKLVVEKGEAEKPVYPLHEGEHLVGRSRSASIRLTADDVSSRHVVLFVRGDSVEAENHSRFGTSLDAQPLQGRVRLVPGQRLLVGRKTVLRLEIAEQSTTPDDDATNVPAPESSDGKAALSLKEVTVPSQVSDRTAGTIPEVISSSAPTIPRAAIGANTRRVDVANNRSAQVTQVPVPPSASGGRVRDESQAAFGGKAAKSSFDQITSAGTGVEEAVSSGESGGTQAGKTGWASEADIKYLSLREYKKVRQRMYVIGGAITLALVLLFIRRTVPPEKISPDDYPDGLVSSPLGEISVRYPKSVASKVDPIANGVKVSCLLGEKQDVPLILIYQEDNNEKWVAMDNATAIREWTQMVPAKEGQWTFDRANPYFMGPDNGVQFWAVPYQRQQDNIWRGMATLIRHGRRLVVMRAEILFSDQSRVEEFLYGVYLELPQSFVQSHWIGRQPLPVGDVSEALRQCRTEVLRDAPATWAAVEEDLTGAIAKAVVQKKPAEEKEGLALLLRLRLKMTKWFNEKKLMHLAACRQNDDGKIRELSRACQAVFSNPSDQRYFEVRKW
jgi:pSer/pThr/pTyr-binding forkhead associated (FHA) protein